MDLTPTPKQVQYVRALQRRHHMPDALLDNHCEGRFQHPFAQLSRAQASELLDEMAGWVHLPPALQRAKGQRDLPGLEP